jgi:hypothetical protein
MEVKIHGFLTTFGGGLRLPGEEGILVALYSQLPRGLRCGSYHEQLINRTGDHDILNADGRRRSQQPSTCPVYILHTYVVGPCSSIMTAR